MNNLRIRKLTPKECFRLMGFDDVDCEVLSEHGISNTQKGIFSELSNMYEL